MSKEDQLINHGKLKKKVKTRFDSLTTAVGSKKFRFTQFRKVFKIGRSQKTFSENVKLLDEMMVSAEFRDLSTSDKFLSVLGSILSNVKLLSRVNPTTSNIIAEAIRSSDYPTKPSDSFARRLLKKEHIEIQIPKVSIYLYNRMDRNLVPFIEGAKGDLDGMKPVWIYQPVGTSSYKFVPGDISNIHPDIIGDDFQLDTKYSAIYPTDVQMDDDGILRAPKILVEEDPIEEMIEIEEGGIEI